MFIYMFIFIFFNNIIIKLKFMLIFDLKKLGKKNRHLNYNHN